MGYMTMDDDSIPQWAKKTNQYCPRCCKVSKHGLVLTLGCYPASRKGAKGNIHIARYKCLRDECGQLVEVGEFAPGQWSTDDMFPPEFTDDIPF